MSSFDWNEFLNLATRLQSGGNEASHRSAVSRAYYAAFHAAKKYVQTKSGPFGKTDQIHRKTWGFLAQSNDQTEVLLGQWGSELRKARNRADYDDRPAPSSREVLKALKQARDIRSKIVGLSSDGAS